MMPATARLFAITPRSVPNALEGPGVSLMGVELRYSVSRKRAIVLALAFGRIPGSSNAHAKKRQFLRRGRDRGPCGCAGESGPDRQSFRPVYAVRELRGGHQQEL